MRKIHIPVLLALSVWLSSCAAPSPITLDVTREVEKEVTRIVEVKVIVTATSAPATPTTEPSPTPAYEKWTAGQVIDAFKAAGLEAEDPKTMTKDDYGMSPMAAKEGIHFLVPSLCPDCGGRVFSYEDESSLLAMKNYYIALGKGSGAFFSWVFEKDNILVQLNGDMPEDQALKYDTVLKNMQ